MELYSTKTCENMFYGCSKLQSISLTINSPELKSVQYMFSSCQALTNLDLSIATQVNASNFTCDSMFSGTTPISSISGNVTLDFPEYDRLFYSNSVVTNLDFLAS